MQRRTLIILFVGGLGAAFFGVLALCAGGAFLTYRAVSGTSAIASEKVDALFAGIAAGDATTYERQTTAAFKQATNQQQFDAIGALVNDRLGKLKSKTTTACNVRSINGQSYADVSYKATFEKGDATITAQLHKEAGDWRFQNFNVQSPNMLATPTTAKCPACGAAYVVGAKFCPSCGKELPAL